MSAMTVERNFTEYAAKKMRQCAETIAKCCAQLTVAQMAERGGPHENTVTNLLLHLEGNIRQWILHGVAEHPDVRERDAEFALEPTVSGAEALAKLLAVIEESAQVMEGVSGARLLEVIDPQPTCTWRHTTVLEAIAKVFGHLEMHTGQIILLTKQMTGRDLDLSMPRKR